MTLGGLSEPGALHPQPHSQDLSPKHIPVKAPSSCQVVPRKPGKPKSQDFLLEPPSESNLHEHLCNAPSFPESQLSSHAISLGKGRGVGEEHLSSSIFLFLMSSMRSRRFWASSWRRRPSSKVVILSCTCFCWFSRTWRRSSLACCKRPVAFFSSSSLSFSICSL